jgi:hypothetical protein
VARSEENDQRSITQETAVRSFANVTDAAGHILFVPVALLMPGQDFSYRLARTDVPQIVPDHPQAFWPLIVTPLQALQVFPDRTLDEIITRAAVVIQKAICKSAPDQNTHRPGFPR